ncbi:ADP-ribosyltransferase SpyB [Streptococcus pyogenes]|uniref:ADP-ribosyltransferase SpyB n=1 Tax=Streptococcus pyogenes TaxID=1314 RepID=A0ABD7UT85_STRPY|nr:ADP-ribosyltransferase SpyB [Streptococcus pyogenes]
MTKRLACLRNWWCQELAKRSRGRVSLLGWCQGELC